MGLLRFLLAAAVVASHLGFSFRGLNPGVAAVVVFYILAGSVVSRLWYKLDATNTCSNNNTYSNNRYRAFLSDRFWRIAPTYYFSLIIALVAWAAGAGAGAGSDFLSAELNLPAMLQNLLVIPLNYYMYSGIDAITLLPPAWSLAVELQFYLLVPFLLTQRTGLLIALAGSLFVFTLAQSLWLNTDVYGYRLLPGVLWIFLSGVLLQDPCALARRLLIGLWAVAMIYSAALFMLFTDLHAPFNREVMLGFITGLPVIMALKKIHLKGFSGRLNRYAGIFSYGVFLLHFPVIWLYQIWLPDFSGQFWPVLTGSVVLAAGCHWLVEQPLWRRFRLQL